MGLVLCTNVKPAQGFAPLVLIILTIHLVITTALCGRVVVLGSESEKHSY